MEVGVPYGVRACLSHAFLVAVSFTFRVLENAATGNRYAHWSVLRQVDPGDSEVQL